ncbi:MAG TPA: hypothetical protein VGC35_03420 [Allosphingosinicella sp.]|jgi:hypothetical protein
MLRTILLIVALLIILAIGAVATGLVDITPTPQTQSPGLNVKINDVDIGTAPTNVQMPTVGTATRQVELPNVTIDKGNAQPAPVPIPAPAPAPAQGNAQ